MTQNTHSGLNLYVALELSNKEWKLAFGDGRQTRQISMPAREQARFWKEVAKAKEKFGLPLETPVYSCYEAGRDGFWIHRMLAAGGGRNLVVDPASIEVNRRARRVKTDRLDASKLLSMLLRHWLSGERTHWRVVHVPSAEAEDARRLHRSVERLKKEKTAHQCRIRSLLALHGVVVTRLPECWTSIRDWRGEVLPAGLLAELESETSRWRLVKEQLRERQELRKQRAREAARTPAPGAAVGPAATDWSVKLGRIKGVGAETAWNLGHEFFGWRDFKNRREVGAAAGLTGSPYQSGDSHHEQGISKAGSARVRHWMTELAWRWLRFQPQSTLAKWYEQRFGAGTGRMRRVGIVALARKLLVALWKYGARDECPEGALLGKA